MTTHEMLAAKARASRSSTPDEHGWGTKAKIVDLGPLDMIDIQSFMWAAVDTNPVCADHDPSVTGDKRSLIGAACHACALVPETSCESRNNFLDRELLVDTVASSDMHLFGHGD